MNTIQVWLKLKLKHKVVHNFMNKTKLWFSSSMFSHLDWGRASHGLCSKQSTYPVELGLFVWGLISRFQEIPGERVRFHLYWVNILIHSAIFCWPSNIFIFPLSIKISRKCYLEWGVQILSACPKTVESPRELGVVILRKIERGWGRWALDSQSLVRGIHCAKGILQTPWDGANDSAFARERSGRWGQKVAVRESGPHLIHSQWKAAHANRADQPPHG